MAERGGDDQLPLEGSQAAGPGVSNFVETDGGRQRFLLELEFIQCLANPTYINYLAQNQYFEDPTFVNYLKYLQYWRQPEYAKFIVYPHSLFFLEMLQTRSFRTAMASAGVREMAHRQQYYFWQHYRNNRLKALMAPPGPDAPGPPEGAGEEKPATVPAEAILEPKVEATPSVVQPRGDTRKRKHAE